MSTTKMFRDRVVSLEQTLELGEKYLPTLLALIAEVLPGWSEAGRELAHEEDLFILTLREETTGKTRRVSFTRMVLSDPGCVPAIDQTPASPARERLLACLHSQANRDDIEVTFRAVMDEEDRAEAERVEAEWQKQEEARRAAKRAEEERRAAERRRQRQQEEERQRAQRERQRAEREARGEKPRAAGEPGAPRPAGQGRRRRRRGGGGGGGGVHAQQGGQPAAGAQAPRSPQAAQPPQARPPQQQGPRPEGQGGGGGRRRRRRGRGGRPGGPGGNAPAGGNEA